MRQLYFLWRVNASVCGHFCISGSQRAAKNMGKVVAICVFQIACKSASGAGCASYFEAIIAREKKSLEVLEHLFRGLRKLYIIQAK